MQEKEFEQDEETILEFRQSKVRLVIDLLLIVLIIIGLIVLFSYTVFYNYIVVLALIIIGLFVGSVVFFYWLSTVYRVTNVRIEYSSGILNKMSEELCLEDIQTVDTTQSIAARILNDGDIKIEAAGNNIIIFKHVEKPQSIARKITNLSLSYNKKVESRQDKIITA